MSLVEYDSDSSESSIELKDPLSLVPKAREQAVASVEAQQPAKAEKRNISGAYEVVDYESFHFKMQSREFANKKMKIQKSSKAAESDDEEAASAASDGNNNNNNNSGGSDDAESESESESDSDSGDSQFYTKFCGKLEKDYQGRSYMHVPRDAEVNLSKEPGSQECFVPKKVVHTWSQPSGSVNKLDFFPNSGHLLLAGGNDTIIRLYDFYRDRELLREFHGHKGKILDTRFSGDGLKLVSCGSESSINLWDTETGKHLYTNTLDAATNVVLFNPIDSNEVLCGLGNGHIKQFDLRAAPGTNSHVTQVYDHHRDAIRSIEFLDKTKFVSSSQDHFMRIWEIGVNLAIKIIGDESQPVVVYTKKSSAGVFGAQSWDGKIQIYQSHEKFKLNRKKMFTGQKVDGKSVAFDFSADGKIVMSGSLDGRANFWDFKSGKLVSSLKIDSKCISCILAHPQESSKVVLAGDSGKIYIYD